VIKLLKHIINEGNISEKLVIRYCVWDFYDITFIVTALSAFVTSSLWVNKYRKRDNSQQIKSQQFVLLDWMVLRSIASIGRSLVNYRLINDTCL